MIEKILVEQKYPEVVNGVELSRLKHDMISLYPSPLAVCYRNLSQQKEPVSLINLAVMDTLATVYQYLALLAMWDIARAGIKSEELYPRLLNMLQKPGLGKWNDFLRSYSKFFQKNTEAESYIPDLPLFLARYGYGKKSLKLTLVKGGGRKSLSSVLDSLVELRNEWIHSKYVSPEIATELAGSLQSVIDSIFIGLRFLVNYPLFLASPDGQPGKSLAGCEVGTGWQEKELIDVLLGLPDKPQYMLKLMLSVSKSRIRHELMMLEELRPKSGKVIFSNSYHKEPIGGSHEYNAIEGILESLMPEKLTLLPDQLIYAEFNKRCNLQVSNVITDMADAGKFDPELYVMQKDIRENFEKFLESDRVIFLLDGPSGIGKSAFLAHQAVQLIDQKNNLALYTECHKLNSYALSEKRNLMQRYLCEELSLASKYGLEVYLTKIFQSSNTPSDSQLILFIDGLNEFIPENKKMGGRPYHFHRYDLFRELLKFAEDCSDFVLQGRIKVVIALRWDVLETEQIRVHKNWKGPIDLLYEYPDGLFFNAGMENRSYFMKGMEHPEVLYENIRAKKSTDMCPDMNWNELPDGIRKMCKNPVLMHLFMQAYNGKSRDQLKIKKQEQLEIEYVNQLFFENSSDTKIQKEAKLKQRELLLVFFDEMKNQASVTVRPEGTKLEPLINKAKIDEKTGKVNNQPYEVLKSMKILREDIVKDKTVKKSIIWSKRISPAHEIVSKFIDILNAIRKKIILNKLLKFFSLMYSILLLFPVVLIISSMIKGFVIDVNALILIFLITILCYSLVYLSFFAIYLIEKYTTYKNYHLSEKISLYFHLQYLQTFISGKKGSLNILYSLTVPWIIFLGIVGVSDSLFYSNTDIFKKIIILNYLTLIVFVIYLFFIDSTIQRLTFSPFLYRKSCFGKPFLFTILQIFLYLLLVTVIIYIIFYFAYLFDSYLYSNGYDNFPVIFSEYSIDLGFSFNVTDVLKYIYLFIGLAFLMFFLSGIILYQINDQAVLKKIIAFFSPMNFVLSAIVLIISIFVYSSQLQNKILIGGVEIKHSVNGFVGGWLFPDNLIFSAENMTHIEELKKYKELKTLGINDTNHIEDWSPLYYLKKLEILSIFNNNRNFDLSYIKDHTNLQQLVVQNPDLKTLGHISQLKNLKELFLAKYYSKPDDISIETIDDLNFLLDLKNLEKVYFSNYDIIDIESVNKLRNRGVEIEYQVIKDAAD